MNRFMVSKGSFQTPKALSVPPSKSQTLRAILFGALGRGKSIIHHHLQSPDTEAMINACRLLGADVTVFPHRIEISGLHGAITGSKDVINAGNSGLVLRLIGALAALSPQHIIITGDESIRSNRPILPLLDGLSQLGVSAVSARCNGYAPIIVRGPVQPGKIIVSGEDSQPISALLIAGAFATGPIELTVLNPGEKPWVALTLAWFDRLGIHYVNQGFKEYRTQGLARYEGFEYTVPGDLSSAAFPIVAALITQSALTLQNIDLTDSQGDKQLIYSLQKMGAPIEIEPEARRLYVRKLTHSLVGCELDINDYIDAIAILAVVGCFAEGETLIYNAAIARKKECDRIHCLAVELKKMGADITELEDGLLIRKSVLQGAHLNSHKDHRLGMALTVAALAAEGISQIDGVDCIAKTYPHFMEDFNALGAAIQQFEVGETKCYPCW